MPELLGYDHEHDDHDRGTDHVFHGHLDVHQHVGDVHDGRRDDDDDALRRIQPPAGWALYRVASAGG